jgi:hypothetical protein
MLFRVLGLVVCLFNIACASAFHLSFTMALVASARRVVLLGMRFVLEAKTWHYVSFARRPRHSKATLQRLDWCQVACNTPRHGRLGFLALDRSHRLLVEAKRQRYRVTSRYVQVLHLVNLVSSSTYANTINETHSQRERERERE